MWNWIGCTCLWLIASRGAVAANESAIEEFNGRPIVEKGFNGRAIEASTSLPAAATPALAKSGDELPKSAVSFGLLGQAVTYSLTFDHQVSDFIALGAGFSYWSSFDALVSRFDEMLVLPVYANFYFRQHRKRLFLTAGMSYFSATRTGGLFDGLFDDAQNSKSSSSASKVSTVYGDVGVGFELRRPPRGFLFRVAGLILFNDRGFLPWVAVNFGYAF